MVRHTTNPWAKKSNKGMKSIEKMAKFGGGLGAAAYSELKKTNSQTKNTDFSVVPPIGWITFLVGIIIGAIVMTRQDNFILGGLYFFGVLILTFVATLIVSIIAMPTSNKSETRNSKSDDSHSNALNYSVRNANSIKDLILQMRPLEEIDQVVLEIKSEQERRATLIKAFELALDEIVRKDEFDSNMESFIQSFKKKYTLNEINQSDNYVEFIKLLIVQDMLNGITSRRFTLENSPINMQEGEVPIWLFNNVILYEEVTKRTMVGASNGLSIKVAKGIYYRVGAFKGEPLLTSSLQAKYGGALILTNRNIFFYSSTKSMKFPYNKIISYVPFEDGIGIQQDKANAKTIFFKGLDGRFAFNVVSNMNNLN